METDINVRYRSFEAKGNTYRATIFDAPTSPPAPRYRVERKAVDGSWRHLADGDVQKEDETDDGLVKRLKHLAEKSINW